ncbi:MAG TPA: ABC transporter permease [Puia sp.]|nr:ABC transporter permease [Puia sp.]
MLKNYFRIAWRNLVKNKVYSALNILGLATGMAVALLIGLWVYYQYSYDRFLPGYQQVYTARLMFNNNGEIGVGPATPLPLADALKKEIPGIKYIAQADWMGPHSLVAGEKILYPGGAMAGKDFLKIFQYPLVKGNADEALKDPYSIVLTQSIAKALFGEEDPVNKIIRIDNSHDVKVSGVLKDLPANSTFQFNFILPFSYLQATQKWVREAGSSWSNKSFQTFVALEPNVSYAQIEPKLNQLIKRYSPEDYKLFKIGLFMQPMKDWHLYTDFKNGVASGGFVDYVQLFTIIGFLVLLIACINFMNLSTARSEKRAREVGIRKAIGSLRKDLIFQFLIESVVITFMAFLFSLLLVQGILPAFNVLTRCSIAIPFSDMTFWCIMIGYVLLTGLLAGSRPAFYLSSFNPIKVLKGAVQAGRSATLPRKVLVVMQFSCSIALIISTVIIYQQVQHAKDRPTGYDANRLMMTDASNDLSRNYDVFKNELLQTGLVTSVTKSSGPATDLWSHQNLDNWPGKLPGETMDLATIGVSDADYFKTLGIQLKEGRNFMGNEGADSSGVILNEAAVQRMQFKQPVSQILTWQGAQVRVIGVAKDALMASPFSPAEPTIFVYSPGWSNIITYRLSPTVNTQQAIAKISPIFTKYNPSYPYLYHFVDESYAAKFTLEVLIGKLAGLFAGLAIFISCLGLFGLAAYTAEQRTKEIGIRKVLGASVSQVWMLLSKDFIVLVLISCVVASPVAFYFLQDWLLKYQYRISIGPWVFVAAAGAAVVITIFTISFQAIRAAVANPVKSLRSE